MINPMARPGLSICALLAFLVLIGLGSWQVHRLQWKAELIAAVEARVDQPARPLSQVTALAPQERLYTPVSVIGQPVGPVAHVAALHDGERGWYVFGGLRIADGSDEVVVVNHGFVLQDDRRDAYDLAQQISVEGLYREASSYGGVRRAVGASPDFETGTFYGRDAADLASYLLGEDADALVFYIDRADNAGPASLPRGGTTKLEFSNRHLGYILTWYGLALGLLAVYVALMRQPSASS